MCASPDGGLMIGHREMMTKRVDLPRKADVVEPPVGTCHEVPLDVVVLPLLGAIVTDRGGQLSHAAIVAREFGIPAVVGTRDATSTIPDGATVQVDGSAGEVRVVSTKVPVG